MTALLFSAAPPARAGDVSPSEPAVAQTAIDPFHELETKYIFGFTEGADIGAEGEKAIELETTTAFGMRGGSYGAIEQEVEFEGVPTQFFGYELSAHGLLQQINNVEGLDNLNRANFSGLSAELRFLIFDRSPDQPIGLTAVAAPEWARVDGVSGALTNDFSTTFRLVADTELIQNRLYAAANLIYTPDVARQFGAPGWTQSSNLGVTAAMAYRIAPKVTLGAELQYYRAFDGLGMQSLLGHALYVGPTMHIQLSGHIMVAAAFSAEVAGHAVGDPRALDLTNFQRCLGNLKVEVEF
ncbi:MAG: hypothetical protein ACLPSF_01355 [Methylocella sp.]